MTDFLSRLAERVVRPGVALRPRPLSRYERTPLGVLGGAPGPSAASPTGDGALFEETLEREAPVEVRQRSGVREAVRPARTPGAPRHRASVRTVAQPADRRPEPVTARADVEVRRAEASPQRAQPLPRGRPSEPEPESAARSLRVPARPQAAVRPPDPTASVTERPAERRPDPSPDVRVVARPAIVVRQERVKVRDEVGRGAAPRDAPAAPGPVAPGARRSLPASAADAPPDARATTGRIEVRAVPAPKAAPNRPRAPVLPLEEYLRRRAGEAS